MTSAHRGMVTAHNQFLYACWHVVQFGKREYWADWVVLHACNWSVVEKLAKRFDARVS